jgi:ribosomal protein S18 acetylase RimI-like enzyme
LAGQAPSLQRVEIDGIPEPDAEAAGAIESCGFRQSRLACLMSIDLASASAPTPLPAEVVPDVWPEEPAALHAVGQLNHEVFLDHDGEYAWSAEEFVHFVTSVPLVRPELSVLVSHDGQPVGLTLAIDEPTDPTGGTIYIASVAVSRAWRGQGIARHLLLETFRRAAAAGMRRATLNVQLGNRTGADRLYESVGMVSSDRELGFTRDLGNPR